MRALTIVCAMFLVGCNSGGVIIVETKDASADVISDADTDVLEPIPMPDAAVCSCNGGFGTCAADVDCLPLNNKCCSFKCEPVGEVGKQCIGTPTQ